MALGGASGRVTQFYTTVTPGQSYEIIIGSGGKGAIMPDKSLRQKSGTDGGTTSFNGKQAFGGSGGYAYHHSTYEAWHSFTNGAQGIIAKKSVNIPHNGMTGEFSSGIIANECINIFDPETIIAAGGNIYGDSSSPYGVYSQSYEDGLGLSIPFGQTERVTQNSYAVKGTAFGCGGSAAGCRSYNSGVEIGGADGADGACIIYVPSVFPNIAET